MIHSRGHKPAAATQLELASQAISHGVGRDYPDALPALSAIGMHLAYYADLNEQYLQDKPYDEHNDVEDQRVALQSMSEIQKRKKFNILQYDRLPGKSALPEFWANLVSPLASMVGLSEALYRRVAPDFAAYFTDDEFAEQVRARVREPLCQLLDQGDDVLVLAHGTGSVVAYDVLWQLSHDSEYADRYADAAIRRLVTLGSPLGDNSVRSRLMGAKKSGTTFPRNIDHWTNVAAEDDFLCHDNTLADDFCRMMNDRNLQCVRDYKIYNLSVRRGRSNPHSSLGYYIHPRVSKTIAEWLGVDVKKPKCKPA